jgi:hypothetical protein
MRKFIGGLAHTIVEAEESHNRLSANWSPGDASSVSQFKSKASEPRKLTQCKDNGLRNQGSTGVLESKGSGKPTSVTFLLYRPLSDWMMPAHREGGPSPLGPPTHSPRSSGNTLTGTPRKIASVGIPRSLRIP